MSIHDGQVVVQTKLIERCPDVDQTLLVGGHAGFQCRPVPVGDGLAGFTDGGVLQEIEFQSSVGRTERYGGRAIAVVNDVEGGKQETGAVPRPPLIVAVNGTNTHVDGRPVFQSQGRREVVGA